jgi:uncharacterized membrane protein
MAIVWLLLGAALVVAISVFHAQNPRSMDLSLYGYFIYGVPLWMLVTVPALAGLVLGFLMALPGRIRTAWHDRRMTKDVHNREKTIAELQARVAQLERDLAVAQRPAVVEETRPAPVVVEETRPAPVVVLEDRTGLRRAA